MYTSSFKRHIKRIARFETQVGFCWKKVSMFNRAHEADFETLEESATEEKKYQLSSALQCLQQELSTIADGSSITLSKLLLDNY